MGDSEVIESAENFVDPDSLITDLDLVAYAEGLLSTERHNAVESLISRCPELSDLIRGGSARDDLAEHRQKCSVEQPQFSEITPAEAVARHSALFEKRSASTSGIRVVSAVLLCVVLIGGGVLHTASAASASLDHLEQKLLEEKLVPGSEQSHDAKQTLMELGESMLLSSQNDRRRRRLLAELNLADARILLDRINVGNISEIASSDALNLCVRVIDGLTLAQLLSNAERQLLVEAWWLKANVEYAFGTVDRASHMANVRLVEAVESLLSASQICRECRAQFSDLYQLKIRGLLAKALHKGAATSLETKVDFRDRLQKHFPELVDLPIERTVETLCRHVTQKSFSGPERTVALLNIQNTLAMHLLRRPGKMTEAESTYQSALQDAAAVDISDWNDRLLLEFSLVRGRLSGNLADLYTATLRLESAAAERSSAIRIFKNELRLNRSNELFFELGWVNGRQLLTQYRLLKRDKCDKKTVVGLLGALDTLSGGFQSMDGFQLAPHEVFFLNVVRAELTDNAEPMQKFSDFVQVTPSYLMTEADAQMYRDFADHELLQHDADFQAVVKRLSSTHP